MSDDAVTYASQDHIALITINRAARMNRLDAAVVEGLHQAWLRLMAREEDRVAVLTGAGQAAFSAGADLRDPPANLYRGIPGVGVAVDKPVIGAVAGWAVGGGMVLTTMCDLLIAADNAPPTDVRGELGKLGLFVGKRSFRFIQGIGLGGQFVLGGVQLLFESLVAGLEREDRGGLLTELPLEPIDRVGFLAELGQLARRLALELLDADFQPPRGHREFGPQLIFIRLDLRHRQGRCGFEPADGQTNRASVDQWYRQERKQARGQKPEPHIHHRFDHGERFRRLIRSTPCHRGAHSSSRGPIGSPRSAPRAVRMDSRSAPA